MPRKPGACIVCGKPVPYREGSRNCRLTCSDECKRVRQAGNRPLMKKICEFCGKEFFPAATKYRFCGLSCASKSHAADRRAPQVTSACVVCGKDYQHPDKKNFRKTCSPECAEILLRRGNPGYRKPNGGAVLDKYGRAHTPHVIEAPYPLPVDPQWQPFSWRDMAYAA